jgi:hypothetical protein
LHFALPESDALAVKRLGPPAFVRDPATITVVMERMYQQIGEYALLLALGDGDFAPPAATNSQGSPQGE